MADCTYRFTEANGKERVIEGQAAFKAYLASGGLQHLMPSLAFSLKQNLKPEDVLKPSTVTMAREAIAKYKKAEPPDPLSAADRAHGENLLRPRFAAAKRNKAAFDATLDKIAESVGGYAKKPGIKSLTRAVTKLITENENKPSKMKDLLRGTIVVNTFQEAQETINAVAKVYTFDRIKNRLAVDLTRPDGAVLKGVPLPTGYQDILANVILADGTVAEIQISTPEMVAAKNLGHEIYAFEREMPNSPIKAKMVDLQKQIYSEAYNAYSDREAKALKTRSNSALSTGSAFSRTSEGLRGEASGTQAVAERQSGETVTGTSFQSKNMVPGAKESKSNFIGTSGPIIPESVGITETPAFRRWFGNSKVVDAQGKPLVVYHATNKDFSVFDRMKSVEWRRPSMDTVGSWFSSAPAKAERYAGGNGLNIMPVYLSIKNPKLYRRFDDFLREMHEAEGRKFEDQNPKGIGSAEGLRAKLKAEGYDGIQFEQTDNESLYQDIYETQDAIQRARKEEFSVKRAERAPYTQKRERLERTLQAMNDELRQMGGSTEFDGHDVFVAFDPTQIKSAIGNTGAFDPNNPDIRYSLRQTNTPEFKKWFGDSKVVDAAGKPLVVYHATDAKFTKFDRATQGAGNYGAGFYFGDKATADGFGANLMPVYLHMRNPLRVEDLSDTELENWEGLWDENPVRAQEIAKAQGYDGVIEGPVYVVFDPTQIKSAIGNTGAFDPNNPDIRYSNRQGGEETEGWLLSRDETGRFRFGAGAKAYRAVADVANNVLDLVSLKPVSPELARAMRKMRMEIDKAQNLTVEVAKNMKDLPEQERQMVSDVIEGELKRGAKPPQRVLEIAATMQSIMSEQSAELVRLGMLSPQAAGRWDGKYLPRFYEQKLGDEVKAWMKAVKGLLGRKTTMQGIRGNSLKARGMFESVPVADLADWEAAGWEVRDDSFDPAVDDTITVWRDYTRAERDDMGEIRDAMFRFVMGYNKSQRDIALGRLYENLAANYASRTEQPGYVQVPATNVEDTFAKRYGKLAGKWVPAEILDQLVAFDTTMQNDLTKIYMKGLSMWKEGKTVLNPVAHANNILSNLTMAHFAGVSYWDGHKYVGALKDLVKDDPMVAEAKEAGLFGGTFNRAELMDAMPEQLRALAQMSESKAKKSVDMIWNALSLWLRKPLGKAYAAEDDFFRYMIYRDARSRGLSPDDAVDYSLKYMFSYDDMPKGARFLRDMPLGLPFFAYTYKVVPALANTALEHPFRYAAPAVAIYTANAIMYSIAASLGGGDDEDWWSVIQRYLTDPDFRLQVKDKEEQERKALPEWMKGASLALGTEKTIRLGMDDLTNLPVFLDISRMFPGGDLFDAHNNAGGVPLLAPITPNSPILTIASAMLFNKDTFRGQDVVLKTDTSAEAAQKRLAWVWKQMTPAIAVGNTHFERAMNVIANVTGQPVNVGLAEYTGIGKDGVPITPGYAALQTVGIKARPIDLDISERIQKSQTKGLIRELDIQLKKLQRLENKGAISPDAAEAEKEKLREKKRNLKQGLTLEGEEKD